MNFINHLKQHKNLYGAVAILLLFVSSVLAYNFVPSFDDLTVELSGDISRRKRPSLPKSDLQITYPNGGETFAAGETITITWHDSDPETGFFGRVKKYKLYTITKERVRRRVNRIAKVSGNSYSWTISENLEGEYKIGIYQSRRKRDVSDAYFTIQEKVEVSDISNGEFAIRVWQHLKNTQCAEDLCPAMSDHRLEELARCNLQSRGAFNPPMPGYDWYTEPVNQANADQMLLELPGVPDTPSLMTEAWLNNYLATIEATPCPLANGEMVTMIYDKMITATCEFNLCTQMSNSRSEELARCNLFERGIYDPPMPGYAWYDAETSHQATLNVLTGVFETTSFPALQGGVSERAWLESTLAGIDAATLCEPDDEEPAETPAAEMGTLAITTTPINGGFVVTKQDGTVVGGSSTGELNAILFPGEYTIEFSDVDGYITPATQVVTLVAGQTLQITGLYMEEQVEEPTSQAGTLTAFAVVAPDSTILIAGATDQMVARYRFHAEGEAWIVNKLTIMNDPDGTFDQGVGTGAVSTIRLKYTDINGIAQTKDGTLAGSGSGTFSGLAIYVPKGGDAFVEIFADVTSMSNYGEALSGQTFRLGIQDVGNSVTSFEAVGETSSQVDRFADGDEIANQSTVNSFVVRKTKPTFTKASLSTSLIGGENRLYGFTVTADSSGPVSFGRLVFDINKSSGVQLSDFKFYKFSNLLNEPTPEKPVPAVEIHDGSNDIGSDAITNNYLSGNKVIVAFNFEETIAAGESATYYLDATVDGATPSSTVSTKLAPGDSTLIPGEQIYASFINTLDNNRNVIWSDKSADNHSYPAIDGGQITSPGSSDWTNGYLLDINEIQTHTLSF